MATDGVRHAVFFYGTLKRGFYNYEAVVAPCGDGAVFQQLARTAQRYPLFVDHYKVPYLVDRPGDGHPISGELFSVDDAALAALDELEGVAAGRYTRRKIEVELLPPAGADDGAAADSAGGGGGGSSDAWLYCIKTVPELEKRGALLPVYSAEVHADYVPKAGRDETLKQPWGGYEARL